MGVDTSLYLNTRWSLGDIKTVIERTTGTKVEIRSNHDTDPGYFTFTFGERMLHVFTNHQTPIGTATSLSFRANEEGHKILKDIAEVLGGLYQDNDYDGKLKFINGNMTDEDAMTYFIKYAIVDDGIAPDDIAGFLDSMSKWYNETKSTTKPQFLINYEQSKVSES